MFELAQSFPTPMEEPKKVLKAQYLGSTEVQQPTGMDTLNAAIELTLRESKDGGRDNVNVAVAPSMISIHSSGVNENFISQMSASMHISTLPLFIVG